MTGIMQAILAGGGLAPFTRKLVVTADQAWTIPADVPNIIRVKGWGAAGAGASNGSGTIIGASGAFIQSDIIVTPGSTLALRIGGGGTLIGAAAGGAGANGGGNGRGYATGNSGGGGGYTGVFANNTVSFANALLIAAGGGGASCFGTYFCYGGGGGAPNGGNCQLAVGSFTYYPTGATQSVGGTSAGAQLQGGGASAITTGGGGGGYYGGGAAQAGSGIGGGGGGGSSYTSGSNITNTAGAYGGSAPNSGDPDYVSGKANGVLGAAGNAGFLVIYY